MMQVSSGIKFFHENVNFSPVMYSKSSFPFSLEPIFGKLQIPNFIMQHNQEASLGSVMQGEHRVPRAPELCPEIEFDEKADIWSGRRI